MNGTKGKLFTVLLACGLLLGTALAAAAASNSESKSSDESHIGNPYGGMQGYSPSGNYGGSPSGAGVTPPQSGTEQGVLGGTTDEYNRSRRSEEIEGGPSYNKGEMGGSTGSGIQSRDYGRPGTSDGFGTTQGAGPSGQKTPQQK